MTQRTTDPYGLLHSRRERRRLAREGSGPGRRFARRVPCADPWAISGPPLFSRAGIVTAACFAAPALRSCDIDIAEDMQIGTVTVSVPREHAAAVRAQLDMICPLTISLDVRGT